MCRRGPVLLHIQCPGGQQASYFESPQLEQISFPEQATYTFQQLFLEFLVFKEYTEPVPVTADLVVRVTSPFRPPPLSSVVRAH